jgi:NTP pyrophosphatase (non-canonical NTP hydrolase)
MENKKLEHLFSEAIDNIYELLDRAAVYDQDSRTYHSLGSEGIASAMRFLVDIGSADLVEESGPRNLRIRRKPVSKAPRFGSSLQELQNEVGEWSWGNFGITHLPYDVAPLLGVIEELGELCHGLLKAAQGIRGEYGKHMEDVADAVGDLVIYLLDFCERNNLDLWGCILRAWSEVRDRDWQKYPKNGRTE